MKAKLVNNTIDEYKQQNSSWEAPGDRVVLSSEAKKIYEAISTLSSYNVGQIRQAIFSCEGEQINLPELVKKLMKKFQQAEIDSSGIKPADSEE